jgi:UDP-N-acetylglucosamine acyltransferase
MSIHPTAIVDPGATVGDGVKIGPYAVVEKDVFIGDDTEIMAHAVIHEHTRIGAQCRVFPHAIIGGEPQDLKFGGEVSHVIIGDRVTMREFCTIHRATGEGAATTIGDDSYLMAYVHTAHNTEIGKNVIIANNPAIAGHVVIGDHVIVSAMVGIHQFVRIGRYAYIGGNSGVSKDVAPYMLGQGSNEFVLHGPNAVGLKRKGFSQEAIHALKDAYRIIFRNHRPLMDVLYEAEATFSDSPEVKHLVEFMRTSKRGVYR